jgi:hypothetical protein
LKSTEIGNLKHNTHNHDIKAGISRHNKEQILPVSVDYFAKYIEHESCLACYVADARAKEIPVIEALKKPLKRQLTRLDKRSDHGLVNSLANNGRNLFCT